MKKLKLILAACALMGAGQAWAQTDVTSTYITNPSFESDGLLSAGNGTDPNVITPTGWTQVQNTAGSYQDNKICNASTSNASNYGTLVSPSDGNYYLFYRHGWNGNNYAEFTSTATNLPAGAYTLTVDYKMVSGSDNTSNNSNTSITLSAISGETTLGTTSAKDAVQVNNNGTTAVLTDNAWTTLRTNFTLTETTSTQFVINLLACGPKRSDFVVDNVRLYKNNEYLEDNTEYYFYNTQDNGYVREGNSWGTQSSLKQYGGLPFTTAISGAGYTLKTGVLSNNYLGSDGFVDNGTAATWFIEQVSTGIYAMKLSSTGKYLASSGVNGALQFVDEITDAAKWQAIKKTDRITSLGSATSSVPTDATFLISNPDFSRNFGTTGWSVTSGGGDAKAAGDNTNYNWQQWNSTFNIQQSVSNLPNGLYTLKAQGFYRPGANNTESTAQNSILFAGDESTAIQLVASEGVAEADNSKGLTTANTNTGSTLYVPNSQSDASAAFTAGLYDDNEVTGIVVSDGSLTVGAKCETSVGNAWTIIDNFRLFYYGPTISTTAVALPAGNMTADNWYYFDIDIDGDYDLTLTTLSDIVITTDGKILIENGTGVTANFSGTDEVALTAGRYYVKSSSAQTLTITPHTFTYAVGDATLSVNDGGYTQSSTFTVTFPSASTNDPAGTAALVASSTATVNGSSVDLTAAENGFSLDLGTIAAATDFAISIPAGVYGYAAGDTYNEAITLTIHTPLVLDGKYYLKDANNQYLSRGGNYATQAIADSYGIPFILTTNSEGISELTFIDSYFHLFDANNQSVYCDNNNNIKWTIEAATDGYHIVNSNDNGSNGYKLYINESNRIVSSNSDATVWTFEALSDHAAQMAAVKDAQAVTAATAAGFTGITTKAGLETYLAANYAETAITITGTGGTVGEAYQKNATSAYSSEPYAVFAEETVSGLANGLYKLSVNAFHRITWNDDVYNAEAAPGLVYVYANDAKTQLVSPLSYGAATAWAEGNDYQGANGLYYPNGTGGADAAFTAGKYVNDVYVYVTDGTLRFGIKNPTRYGNDGSRASWTCFNNFTLTRFDQKINISEDDDYTPIAISNASVTLSRTLSTTNWNTFVVPFQITNDELKTAFGDDVEVAEYSEDADGTNSTVNFNKMASAAITANKPVLLKPATVAATNEYVFENRTVATGDAKVEGTNFDFVGTYAASTTIASGDYFISSNKLWKSAGATTIQGTRAYIQAKSAGARMASFFIDGVETTGIDGIEAAGVNSGKVYNLNGQRVEKAQKGLYIQNGKKVVVK